MIYRGKITVCSCRGLNFKSLYLHAHLKWLESAVPEDLTPSFRFFRALNACGAHTYNKRLIPIYIIKFHIWRAETQDLLDPWCRNMHKTYHKASLSHFKNTLLLCFCEEGGIAHHGACGAQKTILWSLPLQLFHELWGLNSGHHVLQMPTNTFAHSVISSTHAIKL